MSDTCVFDKDFQIGILQALLQPSDYSLELASCIELEGAFDSELLKGISSVISSFYKRFNLPPNLSQLKYELNTRGFQVGDSLSHLYIPPYNGSYYLEKANEFTYNMQLRKRLLKAAEALESGDNQGAKGIIDEASNLSTTKEKDSGLLLFDRDDYSHEYIEEDAYIPTGITALDEHMKGLGVGELGVLIAPPGRGKSQFLAFIGVKAVEQEFNVYHYTLELAATALRRRYEACITGIPYDHIPYRMLDVTYRLKEFHERSFYANSLIKEWPTKQAGIQNIKSHLATAKRKFGPPDMILVDYGDLMKGGRPDDEKRIQLATIYEELRALAKTEGVPTWTVSQGRRTTVEAMHYGMEGVAESFEKVMIADVVLTVCQTRSELENQELRIFIAKNRTKASGKEVSVKTAFAKSTFCIESYSSTGEI